MDVPTEVWLARLIGALRAFRLAWPELVGRQFDLEDVRRLLGPSMGGRLAVGSTWPVEVDHTLACAIAWAVDSALCTWAELDDEGRQMWMTIGSPEDRALLSLLLVEQAGAGKS